LCRLDAIALRLTNIYGPRMALHLKSQGFMAAFLRQADRGEQIRVFGGGRQKRDPVYVDDVAECILMAGQLERPRNRVLNIGHATSVSILEIAETISRLAGLPKPRVVPFPAEHRAIDIGSYSTHIGTALNELGWQACTSLETGLVQSIEYNRRVREFHESTAPAMAVNQ
jgi:nucleoside-diphosphate-sugar epimerase